MKNKKAHFLVSLIFALISFSISAQTLAPLNKIRCSAGVFVLSSKIPTEDLQPFRFSLSADEDSRVWNEKLEKLKLQDQYKSFYSPIWIRPISLTKFATQAVLSRDPIENENISFTLSRFPQSEKRVAGISLEVNIARGYDAAYLVDFKNDGYIKKILSPFKVDSEEYALSVTCDVEEK